MAQTEKLDLRRFPRPARAEVIRFYEARLERQRNKLEDPRLRPDQTDVLRGRIAEIRELLRTFDEKVNPPVSGPIVE